MPIGLFGKLPARRDFVTVAMPRAFLTPWEQWLEAGLRESREALGEAWPEAYSTAPAWRFWLGPATCGEAVLGCLVASCDGIGRSYPLSLVATGDLAPPDIDARDGWLAEAEAFLLTARQGLQDYARTLEALEAMPPPPSAVPVVPPEVNAVPGGLAITPASADQRTALATLAAAALPQLLAPAAFWWTTGGAGRGPRAFLMPGGMPPPSFFTALIGEIGPATPEG